MHFTFQSGGLENYKKILLICKAKEIIKYLKEVLYSLII
jgi:hypothetical protein